MLIGITIPTYNERENLALLAEALLAQSLPGGAKVRLFVVDDNSPDGTGPIADALAEAHPGAIQVIHRMTERGRASAGIAGFRAALADAEVTHLLEMDADFSHAPGDLPKLVAAEDKADIVIGSRYVKGGVVIDSPTLNRILSRAICLINRLVFGVPVNDNSGGYKLYRRAVMETIDLGSYSARAFSVGIETLLKCKRHGFTFVEVPITFRNRVRGKSKLDRAVLFEYPVNVLKLKMRDLRGDVS